MLEQVSKVRSWGRSLGIVLPRHLVLRERLRAGDTVKFVLARRTNALAQTFGILNLRRTTEQLLKEVDEESWDD